MSTYFKTYTVARATVHELGKEEKESALATIAAGNMPAKSESFDPEKDLMKMVSILVSTGKNKNDDVFLPDELMKVRASGKNKPLNVEHSADHIIGHMTRTFITSKDGKELSDEEMDSGKLPEDFDITNEAVVYAFVKPVLADTIRRLAAAGKLFVSVEMWFTDFDFLVGTKLVKRNQATSFLDGHLRANGGDGSYKGEPVGRVLRNALIGGIGVVEKPANPESVIRSISSLVGDGARDVQVYKEPAISGNTIGDICKGSLGGIEHKSGESKEVTEGDDMKELIKEMVETIKASTEAAVKDALVKNAEGTKVEAKEAAPTAPEIKAPEKIEAVPVTPKSDDALGIKSLKASVEALTAQNKKLADKVEAMEHERTVASRRETLRSIGIKPEDVEKRMARAASMTKEEFEQYKADLQELFNSYLRGQASTEDHKSAKEGGSKEAEAPEVKCDENAKATEDPEDTVIDMDKLEDEDPDVGAAQAASIEPCLEDRFMEAIAGQLSSRNKHWRKLMAKKVEEKDEE